MVARLVAFDEGDEADDDDDDDDEATEARLLAVAEMVGGTGFTIGFVAVTVLAGDGFALPSSGLTDMELAAVVCCINGSLSSVAGPAALLLPPNGKY